MSPAEEIHAAAIKLRSLIEDVTDGPWCVDDPNERWGDDHDHRLVGGGKILAAFSNDHNGPLNVAYAAAMHPGVGTAIASWLGREAALVLRNGQSLENHHALAVARQILGSES